MATKKTEPVKIYGLSRTSSGRYQLLSCEVEERGLTFRCLGQIPWTGRVFIPIKDACLTPEAAWLRELRVAERNLNHQEAVLEDCKKRVEQLKKQAGVTAERVEHLRKRAGVRTG